MIEYTRAIDEQISEVLGRRGQVGLDDVPGVSGYDAAGLLRRYMEIRGAEVPLVFEGATLTWDMTRAARAPLPRAAVPERAPSVRPPWKTRFGYRSATRFSTPHRPSRGSAEHCGFCR